MSRIDKLLKEYCPDGVEYKKIEDVYEYRRGSFPQPYTYEKWYGGLNCKPFVQVADMLDNSFNLSDCTKQTISELAQPKSVFVPKNTILVSIQGTIGRVAITQYDSYVDRTIAIFTKPKIDGLNQRYFAYSLKNIFDKEKANAHGTTLKTITKEDFSKFVIPIPPLKVQQEIVNILDKFTALQSELQSELQARVKQYEWYRDSLLSFESSANGVEYQKYLLGDIATVTKLAGFEFTKYVTYSDEGNIIALRGLNVKSGRLDLKDVKYIDNSNFAKLMRSKLHIGDMLFTYVGTIGQVALIDKDDKYYLAPNVALIRCNQRVLLPEYMRYYFQSSQFWDKQISRLLQSSSMQNIPMEKIRQFEMYLPPIDVQKKIVEVLDKFDDYTTDLTRGLPAEIESRQKQYEYYRDKLLSFESIAS